MTERPYVMFRIANGKEIYVVGLLDTGGVSITEDSAEALRFITAAEGYLFGMENRLYDWKVGRRPAISFWAFEDPAEFMAANEGLPPAGAVPDNDGWQGE